MFKRAKPPKHILFIGEKSEVREYIIEVIKNSITNPKSKDKTPTHTFSLLDLNFEEMRKDLLKKTDGTIFLVNSSNMNEHSKLKEFLWEYFVWNKDSANTPIVIASYHAEKALALTASEIIEGYSLIRLTDRLWNVMEIYENKVENILACFSWINDYIDILGIKPKVLIKKN